MPPTAVAFAAIVVGHVVVPAVAAQPVEPVTVAEQTAPAEVVNDQR